MFDLLDEDGVHSFGSSSQLIKLDINRDGIGIGFSRGSVPSSSSACGSCYGAGQEGQVNLKYRFHSSAVMIATL